MKRSYGEPYWEPRRGGAVCRELVTLYGLPIVNRTIGYDRVDAAAAREMFIRCALVEGDWTRFRSPDEIRAAYKVCRCVCVCLCSDDKRVFVETQHHTPHTLRRPGWTWRRSRRGSPSSPRAGPG